MADALVLDAVPFEVSTDELLRRLGAQGDDDLTGDIAALVARSAQVGRPKAVFREAHIRELGDGSANIEGIGFVSQVLRSNLEGVGAVYAFVATCGAELDTLLEGNDDPLMRYALDCIKETALSAATAYLYRHIEVSYGIAKMSSMNPGSGDVGLWPIEQQTPLFELIGDVERLVGVRLTESLLMVPNKTISGVLFPTDSEFISCQLCQRAECPNRRAPFGGPADA